MASIPLSRNTLRPWQWIVIGGLIAGALDILYAMAYWWFKGVARAGSCNRWPPD